VVWDGCGMIYKLSEGTIQYQKAKRKETEEKILNCILNSTSLPASRNIWEKTKIYKNNIKRILEKLVKEGKIIKFKNVKTSGLYQTKKQREEELRYIESETEWNWEDFIVRRVVTKDIYIPNIRNKEMFNFAKQNHLELFVPLYNDVYRKEGRQFLKTYRKKYSNLSIEEAFVRIRGAKNEFFKDDYLEVIHEIPIGMSLILLLYLTKNLQRRIPSKISCNKKLNELVR